MTKKTEIQAIENTTADHVLDDNATTDQTVSSMIAELDLNSKLTLKELAAKINEIIAFANNNSGTSGDTVRDIKSDRSMTEEDARRVLLGDMKDVSTKEAALELGLSYGQIYSCRKGFTFKKVYKEFRELEAK